MAVVCSFLAGWALVRAWLQWRPPSSVSSTSASASVPEWLERHPFLHTQSRLATQHQHVQTRREDAERRRLHLHLSPHFMFNALTSVHWLAAEGRWKRRFTPSWRSKASGTSTGTSKSLRSIPSRTSWRPGGLRRVGIHPTGQASPSPTMHPAVPSCAQILPCCFNRPWKTPCGMGLTAAWKRPSAPLRSPPWTGNEGWLVLTLLDNGIGLRARHRHRVFRRPSTRAREGPHHGPRSQRVCRGGHWALVDDGADHPSAGAASERRCGKRGEGAAPKSPRSPSLKSSHPTAATMAALSVQ